MNKSLAFFGRDKLLDRLRRLYSARKHVLLVGPAGIGKTALLRQLRHDCAMLMCQETSSLRRICDGIERELGWAHHKLNVIERKNRLLSYLERRGEPVAFDHLALTTPRIAQFIGRLSERIPIWIACRSDQPAAIGHVWQHLYKLTRVEVPPLKRAETARLILAAVAAGNIQTDARERITDLHRMSEGNPRILEELLIELAAREYKIDRPFGLDLLSLDRDIHQADLAVKAQQVRTG